MQAFFLNALQSFLIVNHIGLHWIDFNNFNVGLLEVCPVLLCYLNK